MDLGIKHFSSPPEQSKLHNYGIHLLQRYSTITTAIVILILFFSAPSFGQRTKIDNLNQLIDEIQSDVVTSPGEGFVSPTEDELNEFVKAVKYFRNGSRDSCRIVLQKFRYKLEQFTDSRTGTIYDIIRESRPVQRAWGSYIYNEHFAKRLNIQVNHPIDDVNALGIGVDLFRYSHAAWLMIAGTSKRASTSRNSADIARTQQSVFQRIHESLTDQTSLSLSIHSFNKKYYQDPITYTDVVLSNGTTTDEQWGISQISLTFRDSLRNAGFYCSLAMYDSGYASLSANTNSQGIFSNESAGFGHWINIELSNSIRENPSEIARFIQVTDRALDVSGKKISQQLNKVFGLVSPRVVRIDSAHPIMFPSPGQQTYRIISFNAAKSQRDTLNIHVGNWADLYKSNGSIMSIQPIDSAGGIVREYHRTRLKTAGTVLASIVENPADFVPTTGRPRQSAEDDSLSGSEEGGRLFEPIQVHRIPLEPMVLTPGTRQGEILTTSYQWAGSIHAGFSTSVPTFHITDRSALIAESDILPNFLIPIMSNSYKSAGSKFIGVQMTKVLVEEIARLVTEQQQEDHDVNIIAEQNETGEYYLRVFPSHTPPPEFAELKK